MKTLSWYIAKDFLKFLTLTLTSMLLLVVVANLFGNVEAVFSSWKGFVSFLNQTLRSLPTAFEVVVPIAVLVATVVTFNGFSRNSEMVAMKSAGMSLLQMIVPVFVVLLPFSVLVYMNQNYVFTWLNPPAETGTFERYQWRSRGKHIFYLHTIDLKKGEISNAHAMKWEEKPFRFSELMTFSQGRKKEEVWELTDLITRTEANGLWEMKRKKQREVPLETLPDLFKPPVLDAHHMPFWDLFSEIRALGSRSPRVVVYLLEWFQKMAALSSLFIMVLVGAPLAQYNVRRGKVAGEIVLTLFGGAVFWITNETMLILGKGGVIHPFFSAWGVNLVFLFLGLFLLKRAR